MGSFSEGYRSFQDLVNFHLGKIGGRDFTPGKLVMLGLMFFGAYLLTLFIQRALRQLVRPGRQAALSESGLYALSRMLSYAIWGFAALSGLNYMGLDVSHLALIGGAIGVGIGFGLQNLFSNFVSGIVLLLEQTLKLGDLVDLESGVVGRVSEINIRYTRITTPDSVDVIVPNSEFINHRVVNWTLNERSHRTHVPFSVAYGSDKGEVLAAGLAAARKVEGTIDDAAHRPDVWLVSFGESGLNFELVVWIDYRLVNTPGHTQALYLWELETELRRREIEIPFAQRDLRIRSGVLEIRRAQTDTPATDVATKL